MPIMWRDGGVGHDYADQQWLSDMVADLRHADRMENLRKLGWSALFIMATIPWWYGLFQILCDLGIL